MTRTWKIAVLVGAAFVVLCAVVAFAIHWFGANDVEAFAGAWSFIAVALAAVATIIYVRETSDMARAARESAKEQARVAALMEKDLRVRIAPHLRYRDSRRNLSPDTTEYSVLLTCTDSLNLTDYSFEWNQWGMLLRYSAEPHSDGSSGAQ